MQLLTQNLNFCFYQVITQYFTVIPSNSTKRSINYHIITNPIS